MRRAALLLVLAIAAAHPARAAVRDYRAAAGDAGLVRGPLSDFWFKVRSEWGGYGRAEQVIPPGGAILRQRTLQSPPPSRVWVSLVHGDLESGRGAGGRRPLAHLFKEFLSEFKRAEGRNWPYAQIFDRDWERMGEAGRAQNIIMIGTPSTLPPVGPLAESLGFKIAPGRVDVGVRRYRGDNLILIFIAPNPSNPEKYALVITGSGEEALLQTTHLPYGETDYVLFQGRRLLESGFFSKKDRYAWTVPESYEARGSHRGFAIRQSAHYTFWYEPDRLAREELEDLVRQKEGSYAGLAALATLTPTEPQRITYYLYPSVDRKIDETSRDEVAHVDLAASEIHTVFSGPQRVVEPYLDLMVLLHRAIGPTRVPRLERALAIALAPEFQGQRVAALARRAFGASGGGATVLKSIRDQRVMTPADGPPSALDLVLAGFLESQVRERGRERVLEFVARSSPGDLGDSFERAIGEDLGTAIEAWTTSLRSGPTRGGRPPSAPASAPGSAADAEVGRALDLMRQRRDAEAASVLERALSAEPAHAGALQALARVRFRGGDFERAEHWAKEAILACEGEAGRRETGCEGAEAWSRLTLGRVEALRGRAVAAHVELTHPAVSGGPAPVPSLADYWLLTMGQSRNQLTVVSHLKTEARVLLRNLEWDDAEAQLKKALEVDPTDGEAHRLLSEVYHKQHEYWAWRIRYLNEAHPDYNFLGQVYAPQDGSAVAARVEPLHSLDSFNDLVLRGNLELLKAQSLYALEIQNLHAEGDRLLIGQRDAAAALKVYQRALDLNRDFFLSHFLVGRCHFLLDRFDEARRSFEQVLNRRPQDELVLAWTHNYLGYMAMQEDDLAEASRCFARSLALVAEGKVASLARDGLGKVDTIRLLLPKGAGRR